MTHTSRWAVLGAALAGLVTPLLVQPAQAAAPVYVALGDSYSSGTGTRSYIDDGTSCQRSTQAYPSLIAAGRGYDLNFRACSGATIPDVVGTQLDALSAATSQVTISVGGNDAGFADVLTECALPGWASDCDGAIDDAQAYVEGSLPGQLASLYADIRGRAPSARVSVVGYPRIFMGEDCNALTWFSPAEQERLNQMADLINARTSTVAAANGFAFANPTSAFVGHAVCDDPEWLNGLSNPISESYHPNTLGHANGYTPVVSGSVGAALAVTPAIEAAADASGSDQAARQQQYAAADRTVEPKEFVAPDLTTPEVRRAARKAGVDLDAFIARSERAAR
ncbi:SGNH/GDSL hydrolase family protein [Nocardioides hwasunensis]|uniref:SGNH/GDSL hydrolase family protein n=1 Tax=Nocardioides hwasunensis TaxID=397258 RepID=A0ABR8MK13_9ACTN|nr:SGNH/GDSL hydrolase family protein [Nocardioides hwasunensis]MBD3916370.1 SGNH/GDSL hydrolase family protein [Nocardioides hwasunensis]